MCVRPFDRGDDLLLDRPCPSSGNSSIPARLHFSFHKRLSSARILQLWQVWAASNRSRGSRKDNTLSASSFGSNEMKSLWNWGSITCIMCRTCVGSQLEFPDSFWYFAGCIKIKNTNLAISSVRAISLSAFDHFANWANQFAISGGGLSLVGITGQPRLLGVPEAPAPLGEF